MSAKKDETVVQATENAEQKTENAEQKTENAEQAVVDTAKKYLVKVTDNPSYCGIGAGGVQFANGLAVIESARMAAWFKEHKGYTVTEQ